MKKNSIPLLLTPFLILFVAIAAACITYFLAQALFSVKIEKLPFAALKGLSPEQVEATAGKPTGYRLQLGDLKLYSKKQSAGEDLSAEISTIRTFIDSSIIVFSIVAGSYLYYILNAKLSIKRKASK
jgi:hypothetical protein